MKYKPTIACGVFLLLAKRLSVYQSARNMFLKEVSFNEMPVSTMSVGGIYSFFEKYIYALGFFFHYRCGYFHKLSHIMQKITEKPIKKLTHSTSHFEYVYFYDKFNTYIFTLVQEKRHGRTHCHKKAGPSPLYISKDLKDYQKIKSR